MIMARRWGAAGALIASALLAVTVAAQPASASANSFTSRVKIPIQVALTVPCANGGAGETVVLSGTLNDLVHVTIDSAGRLHVTFHDNPQGVRGVGLTTGVRYRGTGATQSYTTFRAVGLPFTFVNNFRIIGQGKGNNFLVHENYRLTINANGTVTATVNNFRMSCK